MVASISWQQQQQEQISTNWCAPIHSIQGNNCGRSRTVVSLVHAYARRCRCRHNVSASVAAATPSSEDVALSGLLPARVTSDFFSWPGEKKTHTLKKKTLCLAGVCAVPQSQLRCPESSQRNVEFESWNSFIGSP